MTEDTVIDNNIEQITEQETSDTDKHLQVSDTLNLLPNSDKSEQTDADIQSSADIHIERRGGARKGAGRPVGSKNFTTLHKEKIKRAFDQRILQNSDKLLNAQLKVALGSIMVFRIDTETDDKGRKIKQRPVLVSDIEEIKDVLDYEYGDGDCPNDDSAYYFVTTKEPNSQAIDSLFDRTFGRPTQGIALEPSKESEYEQLTDEQLDEQIALLRGTVAIEGTETEGEGIEDNTGESEA